MPTQLRTRNILAAAVLSAGVAFGATDLTEVELEGSNVGLILNGYIPGRE